MQTGDINFIYKNQLDKACFQHDMSQGKTKDLVKRTQPDKVLRDKAFKFASNPNCDGYRRGLASMVYKFFNNKSSGSGIANEPNHNQQMNFINQLLENFRKEKLIHLLKTIFGVLNQLICNY